MLRRPLVLFAFAMLIACGGTDSEAGSAGNAQTLASACADLCQSRASCSGADTCESECRANVPAACADETAALSDCYGSVPESERCGDLPPSCAEVADAYMVCALGGDGPQPPAEEALGIPCAPSDACGGTLACLSASEISSGKYACSRTCDVDSDCPENGLCLLFDANDGHYCARRCEADTDCEGTGLTCIVGGERIGGRKICGQ